jgi:pilus assembly protein CpaE
MMVDSIDSMVFSDPIVPENPCSGPSPGAESLHGQDLQDRISLKSDLKVAVIGPEERRRKEVARALAGTHAGVICEYASYPDLPNVMQLLAENFDILLVDVDSAEERALDLVESICCESSSAVMAYSERAESDVVVRAMRAGAREFLTWPFTASTLAEALIRASIRLPSSRTGRTKEGKLLIFVGAKGGSGVTTIASQFAVSLAKESKKKAAMIDLVLPIGDAALELGVTATYTTADALGNFNRLDSNFLSTLLVQHDSGLRVLAAPDKYIPINGSDEAVDRLLSISRKDFDYVVVDGGCRLGVGARGLFDKATAVYLVTQVTVAELRNSNRMIGEFFEADDPRLEIVLNRFTPRGLGIDADQVTNVLTRPPKWIVPGYNSATLRGQNGPSNMLADDSPVSRVVRQMARSACGLRENVEKKSRFSLFRQNCAGRG